MKIVSIFVSLAFLFISQSVKAQPKIIVSIDTAYAHTGKVEIPLSGFGDEITDFYGVFPDIQDVSNVTICGKIGTADPKIKQIGLIQLTPKGKFDSTFGKFGKTILNWGVSDYPNFMLVTADNSSDIFLAGASKLSSSDADQIPAIYKFKKNGNPDSSFGGDGHVAERYDTASSGEFTNIYTEDTTFLACGNSIANSQNGHDGFCAMRFFANGKLDPAFGIGGKAIIPVRIHSVSGFLTRNASITFIGVADKIDSQPPVILPIVLARFTSKGLPDSTFGTNGIMTTSKLVNETFGTMVVGMQPDYKIVAAIPPIGISGLMPVTLVRFTSEGIIDSAYGTNGFTAVAFTVGESRARGINIAKNAKTVVAGSAVGALEQCATSRSNLDGSPDITLNQIGTAVVDVDSGAYSNYLIRFVGIGLKRYIGVGASIHNGISQFLIARFKDDTLQTGSVSTTDNNSQISLYPNPSSKSITIQTSEGVFGNIEITDELGKKIEITKSDYSVDLKTCSLDISQLPNGLYYCSVQIGKEKIIRKFIVAH